MEATAQVAKPDDEVESLYLPAAITAAEAEKTGGDDLAAQTWHNLAETLKTSYPQERGWFLLAQQKRAESLAAMERRRQEALSLLGNAKAAEVQNNMELATSLRQKIIDQYGKYRYLSDLVGLARAALPTPPAAATPAPDPAPEPNPETAPTPEEPDVPTPSEP